MAASVGIEEESGVFTGRIHPHNGYYAGDFLAPAPQGTPPVGTTVLPPAAGGDRR